MEHLSFPVFFNTFSSANMCLKDLTDFQKVQNLLKQVEPMLCSLNYLLGKSDLFEAIQILHKTAPHSFEALPLLLAIRDQKTKIINDKGQEQTITEYLDTPENIYTFLQKTGLKTIFCECGIKNLVDYVFGIEVGLDSNSRKNRVGSNMMKRVRQNFDAFNVYYREEVLHTTFSELLDLGIDIKRFDFVVKTKLKTYLIEVNYYNTSGSKLSEIARSYSEISAKLQKFPQFEFVWITDGAGWRSSRNKLESAYQIIPSVYNLHYLPKLIEKMKEETILVDW